VLKLDEVSKLAPIVVVMLPEALTLKRSRSIWTESGLPVTKYPLGSASSITIIEYVKI